MHKLAKWLTALFSKPRLIKLNLTAVSVVGLSPGTWDSCEASKVMFSDVSGVFLGVPHTDWPVSNELK